jgi:hypothetical protein
VETSIFERATRQKLRFPFRGATSIEDLWDLDLENLDEIFRSLAQKKQASQGVSLFGDDANKNDELDLQLDIVKYIFTIKQHEAADRVAQRERAEKKQRLMELIASKQDKDLGEKSIDELQAMLSTL